MLTVADRRSKFKTVPEAEITQVNEKFATLRQENTAPERTERSDDARRAAGRRGIIREELNTEAGSPGSNDPGVPVTCRSRNCPGFRKAAERLA
jgi:hypothetical protein